MFTNYSGMLVIVRHMVGMVYDILSESRNEYVSLIEDNLEIY